MLSCGHYRVSGRISRFSRKQVVVDDVKVVLKWAMCIHSWRYLCQKYFLQLMVAFVSPILWVHFKKYWRWNRRKVIGVSAASVAKYFLNLFHRPDFNLHLIFACLQTVPSKACKRKERIRKVTFQSSFCETLTFEALAAQPMARCLFFHSLFVVLEQLSGLTLREGFLLQCAWTFHNNLDAYSSNYYF